ncbi:MAG: ATP-binding cassette domain-containing protein [Candidatus Woesearchaeota archaeon]
MEVKDLVKHFGKIKAVDGISFHVNRGEIFAFLGPNGAGKSTTIKMLTTLLRPDRGTVLIDEVDAIRDPNSVRKKFGIVFQDPSVDEELTAYENMYFHGMLYNVPSEILKRRIKELLEMVELWERKDDFVKNFSGGTKRRLEIARGLIHHPKVLFLDEPTIGLDPQTRAHIWEYIRRLNRKEGLTVFFTTHYMDEAERIADYIIVIDNGRIVGEGKLTDILKRTGEKSLEDAFIKMTGHEIREEDASPLERMRLRRRIRR